MPKYQIRVTSDNDFIANTHVWAVSEEDALNYFAKNNMSKDWQGVASAHLVTDFGEE